MIGRAVLIAAATMALAPGQALVEEANAPRAVEIAEQIRALVEADWIDADRRFSVADTPAGQPVKVNAQGVTTVQDAAGAVDGIKHGGFGFHVAVGETDPWWQVDLGQDTQLDRVVIFNRTDGGHAPRTRNIGIQVAREAQPDRFVSVYQHDGTVFYGANENKPLVVRFDGKKVTARIVRLHVPGVCHFALDEVWPPSKSSRKWTTTNCYHVFKVGADGSGLVQLTDGPWDDFDPCFLPSGRIAFISERRGGYVRCGIRACRSYNLCSMKPDGSDFVLLSYFDTNEWHPSVNNEGMIVFTRWDYIDRNTQIAHHLWTCYPDGRDARAPHGNYPVRRNDRPWAELSIRAIPGSQRYVATAAPHHGHAFGSLVLIDLRDLDDNANSQITRLTPEVPFLESEGPIRENEVYGTPWPLSEDDYLGVYDPQAKNHGIYWIDRHGNKELIYRDPSISCLSPIPLRPRPRPPVIPEKTTRSVVADNPFNYVRLVQPVLDRHCVACHREEKALDLTGEIQYRPCPGDKHKQCCYTRSYNNLAEEYGFCFHAHSDTTIANVDMVQRAGGRTIAGKFGARAAKLLDYLDERHYGVKLPDEDFHRIVLWLDCNSEFLGAYEKAEAQARGELVRPGLN